MRLRSRKNNPDSVEEMGKNQKSLKSIEPTSKTIKKSMKNSGTSKSKLKELKSNEQTSEYFAVAKPKNKSTKEEVKTETSEVPIKKKTPTSPIVVKSPKIERQPLKIDDEPVLPKVEFPVPPETSADLSSDSDSDFEEVSSIAVRNNHLPEPMRKQSPKKTAPVDTIHLKNMSTNIENMLRMETLNKFKTNNKVDGDVSMMDDDDDFEEVEEVNKELNLNDLKDREPIQVNITKGKSKKKIDMEAKMARMIKALEKQFGIEMVKSHLVCWLTHGFYLNRISLSDRVKASALSIFDLFEIEPFQLINFDGNILKNFLKKINKKIEAPKNDSGFLTKNIMITEDSLCSAMADLKCLNYLQYILIVLVLMRTSSIKARLCVCFDIYQLADQAKKQKSLIKIPEEASSKPTKRKSKSSEPNKSMPKKKLKSTSSIARDSKGLAGKLSNLADESFSENESQMRSETESSDSELPKTSKKQTKKLKKKIDSSDDEEESKNLIKKNSAKKSNNQILSPDEEELESTRETCARNYWLEVYLEDEKCWLPVEPLDNKAKGSGEFFEKRFERQILYACGFDSDNRVKDVTKRYSSKWTTTTRVTRIDFIMKKLWWERTLMFHQTVDANLDIEEEQQLKKLLLGKGLPVSVSEFKDHPLYVMKRHLLKFQDIYPVDATPIGYLRNEPVYSRDNLATLHSRQTWLKYARVVKPYEKPYKIVKGRIKMSDYKNGCRENPDLDIYGMWQTKPYDPPIAENGRIPLNEFGNVELFQPCMLPIGTVHLRKMPNLNRICRRLKVDCAAAVVGFDAHSGFSHAVMDGWVVCQEHRDAVVAAFEEEEVTNNLKLIEKQQERVWGNWKKLIRSLLIREKLKVKYGTEKTEGFKKSALLNELDDLPKTSNTISESIATETKVNKAPKKSVIKKTNNTRKKKVNYDKESDDSEYSQESESSKQSKKKSKNEKIVKSKSNDKKKIADNKKDIFTKIAAQSQVEIEKNCQVINLPVNDDLGLSEDES